MNSTRLASILRSLPTMPSRRHVLRGLAAAGLGLTVPRFPDTGEARKRHKHKHKKKKRTLLPLQFNAFGCVDVGNPCRGDDTRCCSGICEGNAPQKGKPDTSRCVGHDESGCVAGTQSDFCVADGVQVECTTSLGFPGQCETTTGNAGFCFATASYTFNCFPCRTDADCQPICGPRAACLSCPLCELHEGTACATPDDQPCQFM